MISASYLKKWHC